jgi:hypothetical protein
MLFERGLKVSATEGIYNAIKLRKTGVLAPTKSPPVGATLASVASFFKVICRGRIRQIGAAFTAKKTILTDFFSPLT